MVDFKKDIDFNYISELLDNANYESAFSGDWDKSYVFKSIFNIGFKKFYIS